MNDSLKILRMFINEISNKHSNQLLEAEKLSPEEMKRRLRDIRSREVAASFSTAKKSASQTEPAQVTKQAIQRKEDKPEEQEQYSQEQIDKRRSEIEAKKKQHEEELNAKIVEKRKHIENVRKDAYINKFDRDTLLANIIDSLSGFSKEMVKTHWVRLGIKDDERKSILDNMSGDVVHHTHASGAPSPGGTGRRRQPDRKSERLGLTIQKSEFVDQLMSPEWLEMVNSKAYEKLKMIDPSVASKDNSKRGKIYSMMRHDETGHLKYIVYVFKDPQKSSLIWAGVPAKIAIDKSGNKTIKHPAKPVDWREYYELSVGQKRDLGWFDKRARGAVGWYDAPEKEEQGLGVRIKHGAGAVYEPEVMAPRVSTDSPEASKAASIAQYAKGAKVTEDYLRKLDIYSLNDLKRIYKDRWKMSNASDDMKVLRMIQNEIVRRK